MTLGPLPMALLRFEYRLARIPLQMVESIAVSQLDEQQPVRLAYERFLTGCDNAAAYWLSDDTARERATDLRRHTAAVRPPIANEQHRIQHAGLIILDEQRERFLHRRHHHGNNSV
ncbi:hypothetical protein CJ179_39080 [Rhodococcus sp. ACS1]|uniref:hypothetical protein n=1 Tax=Rhodococcus sp. ACS1 TaxID=2028570 RepID=UPI000BB0D23C|nr:hypothetical protein [Rhodococcus sp. ACS1]PBC38596.1 hypothetical protein CJ179_39080 [Rhodococcus sp. ACS1]